MFDEEETNEMIDQLNQTIRVSMEVVRAIPDEFYVLQAQSAQKAYFALTKVGFNQEQALTLTAASMKGVK